MVTIIAFVVVLGILVFVHELGHFIVAKRAGIQVDEFAFGYPPRLFTLWQSEGEITLDGTDMIIGRKTKVSRQIEANGRVVYESEVDPDDREVVTRIEAVADDMSDEDIIQKYGRPASVMEKLARATEYNVNLIPFGGYVRMLGEEDPNAPNSFASKSKRVRVAVLVAGAAMNIVLAIVVFAATYMLGAPEAVASDNVIVMAVAGGSPAESIGLRMGDIITSMDGIPVSSPDQLVALTQERMGETADLSIKRGQDTIQKSIMLRANPPEGEGAMGVSIQSAVSSVNIVYYPPIQSLWLGVKQTFGVIALTLSVPLLILRGLIPAGAVRPIGPYGIYQQTAAAVNATMQMGWWYPLLSLVGLISTALAITNLLPLPALDGGRIFFIVVEAIRGRRIDPAREGLIHFVGLAALLGLMVVISYFDVVRPITAMDWTSLF